MRKKIDNQIKEHSYLLHALDLNKGLRDPKGSGRATSCEIRGYDSAIFSDDGSETGMDVGKMIDEDSFRVDVGVGTHDRECTQ